MGKKRGLSLPIINKPLSIKLQMEIVLRALISGARRYDKPPSRQDIEESVKALKAIDMSKLDNDFFIVCKAIYCVSYESEIEVGESIYFWNLKKGLSIDLKVNDAVFWI